MSLRDGSAVGVCSLTDSRSAKTRLRRRGCASKLAAEAIGMLRFDNLGLADSDDDWGDGSFTTKVAMVCRRSRNCRCIEGLTLLRRQKSRHPGGMPCVVDDVILQGLPLSRHIGVESGLIGRASDVSHDFFQTVSVTDDVARDDRAGLVRITLSADGADTFAIAEPVSIHRHVLGSRRNRHAGP